MVRFPGERVTRRRKVRALREIRGTLGRHPEVPAGFSAGSVREDRDGG